MDVDPRNQGTKYKKYIPTPSGEQVREWVFDWAGRNEWRHFLRWKRELGIPDNARTIETGCGFGKFSMLLGLSGARVTLLDFDDKILAAAETAHGKIGLYPECMEGDLLNPPEHLKGKFDVACSFGTLEHFGGGFREKAFRGCEGFLREGGLLFFTVPNRHAYFYRVAIGLRRKLGLSQKMFEVPFTRGELLKIAANSDEEPLMVECISTLGEDFDNWIMTNAKGLLYRAIGRKRPEASPGGRDGAAWEFLLREINNAPAAAKTGFLDKRFSHTFLFAGVRR